MKIPEVDHLIIRKYHYFKTSSAYTKLVNCHGAKKACCVVYSNSIEFPGFITIKIYIS